MTRAETLLKYPRTQHIQGSRLQPGDEDLSAVPLESLLGQTVVIEEKIDGANCGVSFSPNGELLLQSRGHYLTGGPREKHFALLKTWANCHAAALGEMLGARYVLYGEWVYGKHTIFYDQLPHYLLEFDVYDRKRQLFLDTDAREQLLDRELLCAVPVLYRGPMPGSREALVELIAPALYKSDRWPERLAEIARAQNLDRKRVASETDRSDLSEGLYIKAEQNGRVVGRYKFVRASFLTSVVDSGSHWHARPIVPNQLRAGIDLYAPASPKKR